MKIKYYIGLDIGTDSIGWAVTDTAYDIIKRKGKAMWGSHCFEAGNTAQERRSFRSARRRRDRAVQRRDLLREFFEEEIKKVDPKFYERLDDSFFYVEDKHEEQKNTLFNDPDYKDKDYHKEYKTIYHLRKALITEDKKFDIRLVYMAIAHILKHRGHFLYSGDMNAGSGFLNEYNEWIKEVYSVFEKDISLTDPSGLEDILKTQMGVTAKKKALNELFGHGLDKDIKSLIELLAGAKSDTAKIFGEAYDGSEPIKICLKDESLEENRDALMSGYGEDIMHLLDKTKAIYDWGILAVLLNGHKYISEAKTDIYDKHAADLRVLKDVIKEYAPEKYDEVFKDESNGKNYAAYIGVAKHGGKKAELKRCDYDTFVKYINGIVKKCPDTDERVKYILDEIEKGAFIPRQVTKDNAVIPYQVNRTELKKILENASKYYGFLNESDEYGTVAEKIESLLTFRIPYYIGPLNPYHGKYSWIEKKSDEKIRPWNFYDIVDTETTAERFIERMTNHCTYLTDEPVLPKNSVLYSKFMVYNDLNNMRVNGQKLTPEEKSGIYYMVYLKKIQPKKKDIVKLFKEQRGEDVQISGIADELHSGMKSYLDFERKIGDKAKDEDMVDEIIRLITIFGEEKKMLRKQIGKKYGDILSEEEIKQISKLNYSGWGRLSKKLLKGLYSDDCHKNIMAIMENNNENFMQIINNDAYGFNRQLEEYKNKVSVSKEIGTYGSLEELYVSPANKKRIWRVMTVVKEIVKVMGCEPEKIFIEMARGPEEKKETVSRKKQLTDLYKSLKTEKELLSALNGESDSSLRRKKLYLYYCQLGRCMYSGERIELSELHMYDIEHIIPRSVKSDDSINNTVLVKRTLNSAKSDTYPIPDGIVTESARELWRLLLAKKFITKEKYDRLTRKTMLTYEEKSEFVARQLVDTRQTTKVVADIFKQLYGESEIVYVKAGNVSAFRNGGYLKKDEKDSGDCIVKVREINDYHHAKDAYLNIVVGNIYNEKFNHDPYNYIKQGKKYNLARICEYDVERAGWVAGIDGTIVKIKQVLSRNNILYTKMPYEVRGGFFDQTLMKKGSGQYPIKTADPRFADIEKYGGYNKISGAYFALVRSTQKGSKVLTLESVPVYLDIKDDIGKLTEYFRDKGIEDAEVVIPKIKMDTLFRVNGSYVRLRGRSDSRIIFCNSNQLCIDEESEKCTKKIIKFLDRKKNGEEFELEEVDGIDAEVNLRLYDTFTDKLETNVYKQLLSAQYAVVSAGRDKFIGLSLEEQCYVLNEILKFFQCNRVKSDLSLIGGAKGAGEIRINKKIDPKSNIQIIDQSATGLYETVRDISEL